jgi:hypothetical protein
MSEIKKYKKYLNFKANPRYLRRDFIVPLYTGTEPDIVPEASIEQQGTVQEFNDGGSVERRGFGKGSPPPGYITGKELEELTGIPNLSVQAKELMYAPKKYKRAKNLFGDFYKKELKAKYFDIGQGGKYGTLHYKKPTTEQIETMKEYHLRRGAKYGVTQSTADRMKLFHNNPKLRNYVRNGKIIPDELLKDYNITRNQAAQTTFRLAQTYNGKKFANVDVGIPENKRAGKKLFETIDKAPFGNPYKMVSYKEALNTITEGIGDKYFKNTTFEDMKREARRILQKEKIAVFDPTIKDSKGININELTGVTASSRNKSYPYSQFINLMEGNLNTKNYAGFNKQFQKYEKDLQNEIAKGSKGNPNEIIKKYRKYSNNFIEGLDDANKAQIEKLGLPELSLKEPTELYGKKRTAQLLEQGLDLPTSYKDLGYSIKVPKGTATLKEFINNPEIRDQMIANIGCPTLISKSLGGRVNFSEGSNCYMKGLEKIKSGKLGNAETRIASQFLKEAGADTKFVSSLAKGGKNAIRLLQDFTVGLGPGGALLTAGLSVPFALAEAAEGASTQRIIGAATDIIPGLGPIIGTTRESELRKKVGPELEPYLKNEQNQLRYNEIEDEIKRLEQNIQNNLLSGEVQPFGYQQERINKLKEEEKQIEKDLLSYEENPNVIKKVNDFAKEEQLRLEIADLKKFGQPIDSITVKEKDPKTEKEIQKKQIDLETLEKDVFSKDEPYEENIEQRQTIEEMGAREGAAEGGYIDYIRDFNRYASGGRIHLGKGGGGPKLSRRGFLGFLAGAAATPFVAKLFKGKKGIQAAKVATKVLPKVTGMPDWFNPLVTRIMNEGVDISPKATRVEDIVKVKKLEFPMPEEGTKVFRKSGIGFEKKNIETITMTEYPDGRIEIEADVFGGSFDAPFSLNYRPPKTDINVETGEPVKYPGDFSVVEQRPKPDYGDPGNFEIDYEVMSVDDTISDLEKLEKIGTGKRIHPKRVEQRTGARKFVEDNPSEDIVNRYGDSEIEYDRMKDEGLFDETE